MKKHCLIFKDISTLIVELQALGHNCWDVHEVVQEVLNCSQNPQDTFSSATESLKNIPRFLPHWNTKIQDNVWIHTKRLENIFLSLIPLFEYWNQSIKNKTNPCLSWFQEIDVEYLKEFFPVHDIAEWLIQSIGDIPTHIKSQLSDQSKRVLQEVELQALSLIWYDVLWISQEKFALFLEDIQQKNSLESQIVSYIDKYDGLCTAIYEFLRGNDAFLEPIVNYIKIFRKLSDAPIGALMTQMFLLSWEFYTLVCEDNNQWKAEYPSIQYSPHILWAIGEILELWYFPNTLENASDEQIHNNLRDLRTHWIEKREIFESDVREFQSMEISELPYFYLAWVWTQRVAEQNDRYHIEPLIHLHR